MKIQSTQISEYNDSNKERISKISLVKVYSVLFQSLIKL